MKTILIISSAVLLIFIIFIGYYRWDSGHNHGYKFGYYGDFNRISNALVNIPGITIIKTWQNDDVTLEEFGFDIVVSNQPVKLMITENDDIRKLSANNAVTALHKRIETELLASRKNTNK